MQGFRTVPDCVPLRTLVYYITDFCSLPSRLVWVLEHSLGPVEYHSRSPCSQSECTLPLFFFPQNYAIFEGATDIKQVLRT